MKTVRITVKSALRAASKKLPRLSMKETQRNLEYMLGDCSRCSEALSLAEAYQVGAEEAQREIVARIRALETNQAAHRAEKEVK